MSTTSTHENTLKLLSDCSNNAINTLAKNDSNYFNLLNEKEQLSYQLLERDTELFKKKNELTSLISAQRVRENSYNLLKENMSKYSNKKIEQVLFFNQNPAVFNFEPQSTDNNIKLKLSNGVTINASKGANNNPLSSTLNKLAFTNHDNPTQAENIDSLYKEDPETILLYLAYNL